MALCLLPQLRRLPACPSLASSRATTAAAIPGACMSLRQCLWPPGPSGGTSMCRHQGGALHAILLTLSVVAAPPAVPDDDLCYWHCPCLTGLLLRLASGRPYAVMTSRFLMTSPQYCDACVNAWIHARQACNFSQLHVHLISDDASTCPLVCIMDTP
jgi:hypothetical protein